MVFLSPNIVLGLCEYDLRSSVETILGDIGYVYVFYMVLLFFKFVYKNVQPGLTSNQG